MLASAGEIAKDEDVLMLARKLVLGCEHRLLIKAFEDAGSGYAQLEYAAARMRLCSETSFQYARNKRLSELVRIVSLGVRKGSGVRRELGLFADRLEQEIKMRNRFRARAGAMRTLTYMGMCIFFPLFSGVSAVILSGSLGLAGGPASDASGRFLLATACYIPMVLYLTASFAGPEKSLLEKLCSIAPYCAFALLVMALTRSYLTNIL